MRIVRIAVAFIIVLPILTAAQQPADTSKPNPDSAKTDSLVPADTSFDSGLSGAEQRFADMQKRRQDFKDSEKALPRFSFYDSLLVYLATERFNRKDQIDRSFFHDAGDYFKSEPEFFVLGYQDAPMRKTVQPFGLTGDRLNIVAGGIPFTPFEHIVEPDGMTDLNDLPTALDGPVYIIPGPAGQLFGGHSSAATLITEPATADSNKPESHFIADRGYFGYAFVRGSYARAFTDGKRIDLSASSRKSDGVVYGRNDEQGHYTLNAELPLNKKFGVRTFGTLYDRNAALSIRGDAGGALLYRERFDRSFEFAFNVSDSAYTNLTELGYRHLRQGSYLDYTYRARFNNTGNGFFLSHERLSGQRAFKVKADGFFTDYDNGYEEFRRFNSSFTISTIALRKIHQLAAQVRLNYSDQFNMLPSASIVYQSEYQKYFMQLALGVSTHEPSLHQLNLSFQQKALYGTSGQEYSESGNPDLKKETELIGSVTIEPGTIDNNISINITGGKIIDAIEWSSELITGATDIRHFMPVNDDITFWTVSVKPSLRIADNVRLKTGGAYFNYDYDSLGERPYQPEYNLFSGLELHYYWAQRLVHLYAYGEVVYVGPYDGYDKTGLGKEIITNAKLSLGLKNFRFYFVFENNFDRVYESREELRKAGRFFFYGLQWHFFD